MSKSNTFLKDNRVVLFTANGANLHYKADKQKARHGDAVWGFG